MGNKSPIFYTAQIQRTNFQKFRIIYIEGKNHSAADMSSRFHTQKELQLDQLKNKYLPPQVQFATLTHDYQLKPVPIWSNIKLYLRHKRTVVNII